METLTLTAKKRDLTGRSTNQLRAEGFIPATVYGLDKEPVNITVSRNEFDRALRDAGESTVVELDIEGTKDSVLIQDYQIEPITDFTTHADFLRVDMNVAVETTIQLEFTGEAEAVKVLGGTFIQQFDGIDVKALPSALVRHLEVDISSLKSFDDVIHVSDIVVPEGIEITMEPETTIAFVQEPRSEAEMEALDEDVVEDVDAVEVENEKEEGEENEEGEE
jgi:large subunit ribosomal protein L25